MPATDLNTIYVAIIIAFLGFMIGLAKGGFGGFGALLTPILSLVLPVASAVGVLLPMLMVGDAFALRMYWKEWDTNLVKRMLPLGVVGALVGTFLLSSLPPNILRIALGIFVLIVVAYRFASDRIKSMEYQPRPWHGSLAGLLAGTASGMFNGGGPPFNSYLLLKKVQARPFIATGAIYFAILNLIKLPGFLYAGVLDLPLLLSLWWVFLFIPLGIWVARRTLTRVSASAFERIIVVLLIFSSLWLFWQSR
ncbi:MAG TPA: sulfite exporter TauE/SafE family protein [Anaerolineales bacterium]|nr:sulfite exporter TauE/SafE family protein [Anaerolineales bacterium]